MKQATGSNTPQSINKVSIQLTLDGHSFSAPALSGEFPGDGPVEVELLTGRHHQIRAQLSKIGCPIRGDLKYGARRSLPGGGISLHSRRVEFEHPVRREPLSVTAPVPAGDNLWAYFENL